MLSFSTCVAILCKPGKFSIKTLCIHELEYNLAEGCCEERLAFLFTLMSLSSLMVYPYRFSLLPISVMLNAVKIPHVKSITVLCGLKKNSFVGATQAKTTCSSWGI
jgi:hypothetical protein